MPLALDERDTRVAHSKLDKLVRRKRMQMLGPGKSQRQAKFCEVDNLAALVHVLLNVAPRTGEEQGRPPNAFVLRYLNVVVQNFPNWDR